MTETGYCGRRSVITIVLIKDPEGFQTAFKAETDAKCGGNPNQGSSSARTSPWDPRARTP
ncbi:hypothetical protein ACFXB3_26150 [Streptomyces sp. NPDC059447]|uniref:hypothetical protein n=1 Tax=unclassified Streptomyces TaxID=2593676 RepID=UPI0036A115A3